MSGPAYPGQPGPDDQNYPGNQYGQEPQYPQYGQDPRYGQPAYGGPPVAPKNGLGIAALIFGILSILAFWTFGFGILLGVIAVILGVIGRGRVKRREATNGGVATTGIVLGILGIIGGAVFIALSVWVFNAVGGQDFASCVADAGGDQARREQCARDFTGNLQEQLSVTITPLPTP
jgi:hypothetical protein